MKMQPDERDLERILDDLVDTFLIPRFKALGMNATGKWIAALEVRGNKLYGAHYTEQLVHGRRPQQKTHEERAKWAYGMANFNPEFKKWLQVRGLTQYGFQIAYKLDKEGTTWYKKGGSNLLEVLEEPATRAYVLERVGAWYRVQVKNELIRMAKETFKQ